MSVYVSANIENEKFIYPQLQGLNSFRLLLLKPGREEDTIEGTLVVPQKLLVVGSYIALSYVWGTDGATERITLDEQNFWVRPNLHNALIRLRATNESRMYFIDAICINQSDLAERNAQIGLMGSIFKGAGQTIVWLGEDDEEEVWRRVVALEMVCQKDETGQRYLALDCENQARLVHMFEHEYWTRLWIVPEIVLSHRVDILWSCHRIDWTTFRDACDAFDAWGYSRLNSHFSGLHGLSLRSFLMSRGQDRWFLGDLLLYYQKSKSHDPRDFVYALSTLSRDSTFEADYSIDLCTLFWNVLRFCHRSDPLTLGSAVAERFNLELADLRTSTCIVNWTFSMRLTFLGTIVYQRKTTAHNGRYKDLHIEQEKRGALMTTRTIDAFCITHGEAINIGDCVYLLPNWGVKSENFPIYFIVGGHLDDHQRWSPLVGIGFDSFRGKDNESVQILYKNLSSGDYDLWMPYGDLVVAMQPRGLVWLLESREILM